jgi:hypothetical protein
LWDFDGVLQNEDYTPRVRRSGTDELVFHVKILRSTTTYQFTPRLLIRNIWELFRRGGAAE